jgi:hypothetical protein
VTRPPAIDDSPAEGLINLTAHIKGKRDLPCLCRKCLDPDLTQATARGLSFLRASATSRGRILYFWMPEALRPQQAEVTRAVEVALAGKLREK